MKSMHRNLPVGVEIEILKALKFLVGSLWPYSTGYLSCDSTGFFSHDQHRGIDVLIREASVGLHKKGVFEFDPLWKENLKYRCNKSLNSLKIWIRSENRFSPIMSSISDMGFDLQKKSHFKNDISENRWIFKLNFFQTSNLPFVASEIEILLVGSLLEC